MLAVSTVLIFDNILKIRRNKYETLFRNFKQEECHSSAAEYLVLKPEELGSTPGGATNFRKRVFEICGNI